MNDFKLHEDRFFDPNIEIRKYAREIYNNIKELPIISPHGHVDPQIFVDNEPFPNPTELFLIPDHYVFRMLYSQGIRLESLGIPTIDGSQVETDPRKSWQLFADHYYLFNGTPSGTWLDHEFNIVFGIKEKLNKANAQKIYDELNEKLNSNEYLPRTLFDKFKIEVLSTTDAPFDSLHQHKFIKESDWRRRILPAFRPDGVTDLSNPLWKKNIEKLSMTVGYEIDSYKKLVQSLQERRYFFKSLGATSTDHGVMTPRAHDLGDTEAEKLFQKAFNGTSTLEDANDFTAHMLIKMADMSVEDGLVMQIHAGAYRNHNYEIYIKYGTDKGADIPMQCEYVKNMQELLNRHGNNPNFTVIVFTLDETTYSRELAPLAGHYPAMKLGPAWWFHDSIEGMTRFRRNMTETGGFYNTVGFIDDTRAFVSIPARHDVARRVDSNYLGELVAKHMINLDEALIIAKDLTYNLAKKAYKL
jgi:glucuronate isomerase